MSTLVRNFLDRANFEQAWIKVRNKKGCAGIDEETLEDFAEKLDFNLDHLRKLVASNNYQSSPLKQVYIPKNKGKLRELRIPTIRDRIVQQALLNILVPIVEPHFSDCSFAYRPNLSIVKAVERIAYWRDRGYQWILDADIVKFFDSIDRQILLSELRRYVDDAGILYLIKSWISADILTKQGLLQVTRKGIPQGAVVSPLLANIYLNQFDLAFQDKDIKLIRYADDFLVLGKSRDRILQAYTEVVKLLHSINLVIHTDKTQITNFDRGFRFLGHGFYGNSIIPLVSPNRKKKLRTRKQYSQKLYLRP